MLESNIYKTPNSQNRMILVTSTMIKCNCRCSCARNRGSLASIINNETEAK